MIKKPLIFFAVIYIVVAMFSFSFVVCGADQDITQYYYADFLDSVGLFKGTDNGYELEKIPNRSEALVMLIRMIGKESEALKNTYSHPFTDSGWADKYIGYAYGEKISNGISENIFGSDKDVTEKEYCTFILRALGYSDTSGDFDFNNADVFAASILNSKKNEKETFTRGKMAYMSYNALYTKMKNSDITLAENLITNNLINIDNFKKAEEKINCHIGEKKSVTIMIYMIASDLESLQGRATNDLKEMMSAIPNENVNLYVLSGGTSNWKNSIMSDGKTQIFKLNSKNFSLIKDLGTKKITEPNTLTDFVKKCALDSPADRYMLVFWDHGRGTMGGFGKDELNQNSSMNISKLKVALENTKVKFDIIGFDACLMATVETAAALKNVCSFMIASEELTPACGWYYGTWLDTLSVNPSIDTLTLSKIIVDSAVLHASIETNADSLLSIIDVKKVDNIYEKLKNILVQDNLEKIQKSANETYMLGEKEGGYDQFDLLNFFGNIDKKEMRELSAAVKKTVIYNRLSAPFMQACGLAFYYPKKHIEEYEGVRNMLISIGYEEQYFKIYENVRGNINEE